MSSVPSSSSGVSRVATTTVQQQPSTTRSIGHLFRRAFELLLLLFATIVALFSFKSAEKANKEKERLQRELRRVKQDRNKDGGTNNGMCSVCLERPLEVSLEPCGHVALCRACVEPLQRCPICRADIQEWRQVFVAN